MWGGRRIRDWRRFVATLVVAVVVLQGCSGTMLRYNYDDESDACYGFRDTLITTQEAFDAQIVEWTIIGAAGGLVAGVTAVLISGNRNPLLALAPALAGAVGGYLVAVNRQGVEREQLATAVNADAAADRLILNRTAEATRGLTDCRIEQMVAVRRGIETGTVSSGEGRERLTQIRESIDGDRKIVTTLLGRFGEKVDIFAGGIAVAEDVEHAAVLASVRDYEPTVVDAPASRSKASVPAPAPAEIGPTTTMQASAGVNVRSGPSTSKSIVGTLSAGQRVETAGLADNGTWYNVVFQGARGYVHRDYLVPPGTVTTALATTQRAETPSVDTSRRPTTRNEVEQLAVEQKEIQIESEARFDTLAADLEALEVLLS